MGYNKVCRICNCVFVSSGPAGVYCKEHAQQVRKEKAIANSAKSRAKLGKIAKPGVGKGGNPKYTTEHWNYKEGRYVFDRLRSEIKRDRRYCERCSRDLIEAKHHLWVVHHKDHNHWNHDTSNLELLCKRCHQIEHECYKAFTKGATTSSNERTD